MAVAGQIVLLKFPQTDLTIGKLRPVLLLKSLSNRYDDWLVSMISTKTGQEIIGLDNVISPRDRDFRQTGLKSKSIVRVLRLAVVSEKILLGTIGEISPERLKYIKQNLANWILTSD
ncbi:MAG: type II toxin-antitoxin system PemK/MazF family toxin [Xenococcus sp. (in: cyanobacteria)]